MAIEATLKGGYMEENEKDLKGEEKVDEEEMQETETEREVKVGFEPDITMFIYVNKQGKLEVELKGVWTARLIRAIQLAVIKAYRAVKKEANTKKEE